MFLLGSRAPGRNTEQHDIFFAIGESIKSLVPDMIKFWPEAKKNLHVDAWREVTATDGYRITIQERNGQQEPNKKEQLFFINLGGYKRGVFDEPHYKFLTVQRRKQLAVAVAKKTAFYAEADLPGGRSHIDDHYGVDVDDIHNVSDILPPHQKERYTLSIIKNESATEDELHLGYFKLDSFK